MFQFIPYNPDFKTQWSNFVEDSVNGLFLFDRSYMDYHKDRFVDSSVLVYEKNKLVAVLPANSIDDQIYSHMGLSFGGFLVDTNVSTANFLSMFGEFVEYLHNLHFRKLFYKPSPFIYHRKIFEADLYSLFRYRAKLHVRNVTTAINLSLPLEFHKMKRRNILYATKNSVVVGESNDLKAFYKILSDRLDKKYNATPVHTLAELKTLKKLFPNNIKLFAAFIDKEMVSGIIIYEYSTVAHCQYIASSEEGRKFRALDLLFEIIIKNYQRRKLWFDFGTSNESNGQILNDSLIISKERFGARPIVQDTYTINL